MTTQEVLNHHLESFGKGDVDELVSDFTEESVVITPTDTIKGLDAIRGLFEAFTTDMLPPGCTFEMIKMDVSGDVAYVFWNAESDSHKFTAATDTFVVKEGKILVQTFAGLVEEK